MVKKIIKISLTATAICTGLFCIQSVSAESAISLDNEVITQLNEDSYKVTLNLKDKTANVDGESKSLKDVIGLDDQKIDELANGDQLIDALDEQLIGNVTKKDDTVSIYNYYSLNRLIAKTDNADIFDQYEAIKNIEKGNNSFSFFVKV